MKESIESDYNTVNLISILAIVVILVFTFKSVFTPIVLIMAIEAGIFINMGIPFFMDESLNFIGYLIVSSVELGATIDYAILMTNNYLRFRKHYNKKMAAMNAIKESLSSIITSGSILTLAGYIIKFNSSIKAVSDIGELIGRGALISVIMVVIVLPQFLALFDRIITPKQKDDVKEEVAKDNTEDESKASKKVENKPKEEKKAKIKPREYMKHRHQKYREWRARNRDAILGKVIEKAEKLKKETEEQISLFENKEKDLKEGVKDEKTKK